jgi:uncharacterized membrane protein YkvA (DUF1232 family)
MRDAAEIINTIKGADGVYTPASIARDAQATRGLMAKLARVLGRVPFADDLVAAWLAARDPKTPMKAKAILFAAAAYFVMPVDMVPDVLIGLGFTDDATVLAMALGIVGAHVKPRHRARARDMLFIAEPIAGDD